MGNCCWHHSTSQDDISLLRGQSERQTLATQQEELLGPPPPYQETSHRSVSPHNISPYHPSPNAYHPSPNVSRSVSELSEEEQVKVAQRIGLIQHLPTGIYDGSKKNRECVICMIDLVYGDEVRFLPCLHTYHSHCIDSWLLRSFTCPSCMEPVDSALLTSYHGDMSRNIDVTSCNTTDVTSCNMDDTSCNTTTNDATPDKST